MELSTEVSRNNQRCASKKCPELGCFWMVQGYPALQRCSAILSAVRKTTAWGFPSSQTSFSRVSDSPSLDILNLFDSLVLCRVMCLTPWFLVHYDRMVPEVTDSSCHASLHPSTARRRCIPLRDCRQWHRSESQAGMSCLVRVYPWPCADQEWLHNHSTIQGFPSSIQGLPSRFPDSKPMPILRL